MGPPGERLAVFGGSFDPVHAGHLHAAEAARAAFALERVLLVPAARSPFKREATLAPGEERAHLLDIIATGRPWLEVWRGELGAPPPSYTLDTLRRIVDERAPAELFLLIGADQLEGLPGWRGVEEILALARPIVVPREGDPRAAIAAVGPRLSAAQRAALSAGILDVPPLLVSATELRAQLARGEDPGDRLPPGVLAEIRARGLYGWPAG